LQDKDSVCAKLCEVRCSATEDSHRTNASKTPTNDKTG
jgi:hypothetical protein